MSGLHIHLDAVGGVAGDMFVAALVDALPMLRERVLADIAAILPANVGRASIEEGTSAGLSVRRIRLAPEQPSGPGTHGHGTHSHAEPHARFADMLARIRSAPLSDGTSGRAIAILTHLAQAEAQIHGVAIDDVHFHEIADWDSLMDVVAAGSIAAALDASWSVSDLPRGHGLVHTRHGLLPVPAPATAAILTGFHWRDDGIEGERVTPTGAAILKHLVSEPSMRRFPGARLAGIGTGAGSRELPGMPNILRALVFEPAEAGDAASAGGDRVISLCFDIDDMTGEEIGVAAARLRNASGVLDLAIASAMGKKNRPLSAFRLIVRPDALESVSRLCFEETTTIGLRWHAEQRALLPRMLQQVPTEIGAIGVKRARRPDGTHTLKPESDDLEPLAGLARRRALKSKLEGGD